MNRIAPVMSAQSALGFLRRAQQCCTGQSRREISSAGSTFLDLAVGFLVEVRQACFLAKNPNVCAQAYRCKARWVTLAASWFVIFAPGTCFPGYKHCGEDVTSRASAVAKDIDSLDFASAQQFTQRSAAQVEKSYELKSLSWYKEVARTLVRQGCIEQAIEISRNIRPTILSSWVLEVVASEAAYAGKEPDAYRVLAMIPPFAQWPSPRDGALMLVAQGLISTGKITRATQCADVLAQEARVLSGRLICAEGLAEQTLLEQAEAVLLDDRFSGDRWSGEISVAEKWLAHGEPKRADRLLMQAEWAAEQRLWGGDDDRVIEPLNQVRERIVALYLRYGYRSRALAVCQHSPSFAQVEGCRSKVRGGFRSSE